MKNNKKLRIVGAVVCSACLLAALPACGNTATDSASTSATTSSAADLREFSADDVKTAMDLDTVYVLQGAENVSIQKAIEGIGFDFVKSVTCDLDGALDTSLEQSRSVTYTVTVDLKALAKKLSIENADDYTGTTEIQVPGRVNVINETEAADVASKDTSAIIIKSNNETYQPITDANTPVEDPENTETVTGSDATATGETGSTAANGEQQTPASNGAGTTTTGGSKTNSASTPSGGTGNSGTTTNTGNTGTANTGSGNKNTGSTNTGSTGGSKNNSGSGTSGGGTTNTGTSTGGTSKPAHTHNWQPVYKTVHHDEVGHYETVTVSEAYDEPIYGTRYVCSVCKASFDDGDDICDHIEIDHDGAGSYSVDEVQVGTKHHDAVTKQQYVVDQKAYDEQVLDHYECSCGATK